ncbi:MAG: energy transducer TonB [Candidatus Marinimicrobia bacterium]|nr:energy transducer TonB [Candidatus Neomarinimicrobiota bacterium]MDP6457335.1 energy transducer TonB [Candidatus Neomarinimicrobiota bacterium]MDP6592592.1 energy transducer TonB [Candidatus Neomarinimicrobiota bacterium]MDP6836429.1 energy transducer TonB [Candidatus Neomarinimicrobiota bacterium]|tara:strand:- start:1019 stop:1666 length:648 start_codon:yes stop_codon:yes gene_type:complete
MIIRKNPSVSLKLRYPITVRATLLVSVVLLITLLVAFPKFEAKSTLEKEVHVDIEQFDIPQTQQFELPPPPSRPAVPVESENEDLADDVTIEETELDDFVEWESPPPPPEEGPRVRFIPYDDPPVPVGGYGAIQRNIIYPEIAQEAGIEGTVVIQAFVSKKGKVTDTLVLKGIPNTGLDEAAMEAIKKTGFKPAKQRDRAVGVWISIPVNFRLKG